MVIWSHALEQNILVIAMCAARGPSVFEGCTQDRKVPGVIYSKDPPPVTYLLPLGYTSQSFYNLPKEHAQVETKPSIHLHVGTFDSDVIGRDALQLPTL